MRISPACVWVAFLFTFSLSAAISAPRSVAYAQDSAKHSSRPYGIPQRIPWTSSKITGRPEPPLPYRTEQVFPKLKFVNPVEFVSEPGTDRLFVMELTGKIFSFINDSTAENPDLVIDLAKEIPGMTRAYGMTFDPGYRNNRFCYLSYILAAEEPLGTRVSRFKMTDTDPPAIDPHSEQILIRWKSGGHNGGALQFGPDGYFYISTGDGGPAFPPDPLKSGQDVSNILSSILRIDVSHATAEKPYSIPKDNPFVDLEGARREVWAYGLRNPWKMSFDPKTEYLWVGDVGWELWEMIYRIEKGGNYGWSLMEAHQPVHRERKRGPTPISPPTVEHSHIEARSITGGYVYHGKRLQELAGAYIYGDYVTGKVWGLRYDGSKVTWQQELVDAPIQIICFGLDQQGELYLVDYAGTIHRLVPNPSATANRNFPKTLSETGLFSSVKDHQPAPGVVSYSISAEPWADNATTERFVALPGKAQLSVFKESNAQIGFLKGMWSFPTDGVLAKTISLEMEKGNPASSRRLETQILHFEGDMWRGYNYIWNDEQTDAVLADFKGFDRTFTIRDKSAPGGKRQQTWHFASRSECILCHTTRSGSIQGFNPLQLNSNHDYGAVTDNQLRTLAHIGLYSEPLNKKEKDKTIPSPYDETADLNNRARAYLHVNCGHCHRRGGGGTAAIEVLYNLSMDKTHLLDARPTQGAFGIHAAQVLAKGDPFRSVLYYRMAKLGRGRMPYFGSNEVDEKGVKLIHDWIANMPHQPADDSTKRLRVQEHSALARLALASKQNASPARRQNSIEHLLSTTSGSMLLLKAVDGNQFNPQVQEQIIQQANAHADVQVRDLFERFLPADKRTKRLGSVIDPATILSIKGDASRGRKLFTTAAGVQCKSCHILDKVGKELGPDLKQIGKKYDRVKLLESILDPSRTIDPKYVSYIVETTRGKVHTGLLVTKTEIEVVLKDATGKEIRIPAKEVELIVQQRQSIMPELLLRDMTAAQVADLLEYLSSLK